MSHRRPPLLRALQLNTGVMVVEIAAGIGASSFSLIMDGIHNPSDEVALFALLIAAVVIVTTSQAVIGFHKELLWPDNVSCGDSGTEQGI